MRIKLATMGAVSARVYFLLLVFFPLRMKSRGRHCLSWNAWPAELFGWGVVFIDDQCIRFRLLVTFTCPTMTRILRSSWGDVNKPHQHFSCSCFATVPFQLRVTSKNLPINPATKKLKNRVIGRRLTQACHNQQCSNKELWKLRYSTSHLHWIGCRFQHSMSQHFSTYYY